MDLITTIENLQLMQFVICKVVEWVEAVQKRIFILLMIILKVLLPLMPKQTTAVPVLITWMILDLKILRHMSKSNNMNNMVAAYLKNFIAHLIPSFHRIKSKNFYTKYFSLVYV